METVQAAHHRTRLEHLHMRPEHGAPGLSQFESYGSEFLFTLSFPGKQQAHTPCPQAECSKGLPFATSFTKGGFRAPKVSRQGSL